MLCFIVIWRYLDSLGGDIKKLKSGNSSTSTQIASLVDFPKHYCKHHLYHHHHRNHHRPHNHYEHQNHHHHCQLDHLRHSRGDNDVPGPLFTVIRYPTQFFTRFWCKSRWVYLTYHYFYAFSLPHIFIHSSSVVVLMCATTAQPSFKWLLMVTCSDLLILGFWIFCILSALCLIKYHSAYRIRLWCPIRVIDFHGDATLFMLICWRWWSWWWWWFDVKGNHMKEKQW